VNSRGIVNALSVCGCRTHDQIAEVFKSGRTMHKLRAAFDVVNSCDNPLSLPSKQQEQARLWTKVVAMCEDDSCLLMTQDSVLEFHKRFQIIANKRTLDDDEGSDYLPAGQSAPQTLPPLLRERQPVSVSASEMQGHAQEAMLLD
jgi:hypothetical protein